MSGLPDEIERLLPVHMREKIAAVMQDDGGLAFHASFSDGQAVVCLLSAEAMEDTAAVASAIEEMVEAACKICISCGGEVQWVRV